MNYQQQIKHPLWQKKRLEVLDFYGFQCQECEVDDEELHVHHPFYRKGAMIWEYETTDLQCLCHKCHQAAHALDEKIKKALALCRDKERVLEFIQQLNSGSIPAPPPPKKLTPKPFEEQYHSPDWMEDISGEQMVSNADEFFARMKQLFAECEEEMENGEN